MRKKNLIQVGNKRLKISYDPTKEVGGIILGRRGQEDSAFFISRVMQLRNRSSHPEFYQLPRSIWVFLRVLPYLFLGEQIIGEWHTHINGRKHPTPQDERAISRQVQLYGKYLLGIVSENEMRIYRYEYQQKTHKREQ